MSLDKLPVAISICSNLPFTLPLSVSNESNLPSNVFILVSFVVFSLIAILGGTISEKIKTSKNIGVWMQWMQVFVFIGIAVFILI